MHFIQESEDWGQRDFSSSLSRAKAMECKTRAVSLFCEDSQSEIRENEADKQRIRERDSSVGQQGRSVCQGLLVLSALFNPIHSLMPLTPLPLPLSKRQLT